MSVLVCLDAREGVAHHVRSCSPFPSYIKHRLDIWLGGLDTKGVTKSISFESLVSISESVPIW